MAALIGFTLAAVAVSQAHAQFAPGGPARAVKFYTTAAGGGTSRPSADERGRGSIGCDGAHGSLPQEMRPITAVNTNIGVKAGGSEHPEDVGAVCHPAEREPTYGLTARAWSPLCYFWEATGAELRPALL